MLTFFRTSILAKNIGLKEFVEGLCFAMNLPLGQSPYLRHWHSLLEVRTKYYRVERNYILSFICFNLAWLYSVTIFKWSKSRMGSRGMKMNVMNFSLWSKLMQGHCTPFTHSQPTIGVALDYKWNLIHWIPNDWLDIV